LILWRKFSNNFVVRRAEVKGCQYIETDYSESVYLKERQQRCQLRAALSEIFSAARLRHQLFVQKPLPGTDPFSPTNILLFVPGILGVTKSGCLKSPYRMQDWPPVMW
jgi:aldehyde:ferredoxin oxidoreductase